MWDTGIGPNLWLQSVCTAGSDVASFATELLEEGLADLHGQVAEMRADEMDPDLRASDDINGINRASHCCCCCGCCGCPVALLVAAHMLAFRPCLSNAWAYPSS